jgi:enolase-phosphatase E1
MPKSRYNAVRGLLLDIEGTTTPISFVHDVLFPYARSRLRQFLKDNARQHEVRAELRELIRLNAQEIQEGAPAVVDSSDDAMIASAAEYCLWLMDRDRKSPPLKAIQGLIWEHGYRDGDLQGEVFADVPGAFSRWNAARRTIAIFSSGSVLAQRLLFAHTCAGDLTKYISSFFDTRCGPKHDRESYRQIAAEIQLSPASLLFVSDVTKELAAASEAGFQTALSVRPGNPATSNSDHAIIHSFDELILN